MAISERSDEASVPAVTGTHGSGGFGVLGQGADGSGVVGDSTNGHGVVGVTHGNAFGVLGQSVDNSGTVGESTNGHGIVGIAHGNGFGVFGQATDNSGVVGESTNGNGVVGIAHGPSALAGLFVGDVEVTGDIRLTGADVAEEFEVVGELAAEPGSVVVLAGDDRVRVSEHPYDRRVAGIISGAGTYRPGLVLDRPGGSRPTSSRRGVALTGKVWCKADAGSGSIVVGDMLTTSATPGHAMRAADPARAFGAVIGKALGSLNSGRGLVLVLVGLR